MERAHCNTFVENIANFTAATKYKIPSAFALDLFGFGVYTFPPGAAGARSFHDPLEGTETRTEVINRDRSLKTPAPALSPVQCHSP